MRIVKQAADLSLIIDKQRNSGKKTGFVPTMGALHEGHLSLIRQAACESDFVVCSIFVNPTQFNDPADFEKYPVSTAEDIALLAGEKTAILFLPAVDEIYPAGTKPAMHYPLGRLENLLEGAARPGHFQGVCQVVHRLLDIVNPDLLFLGQKDYQQCMVLQKLLEITHKSEKIRLRIGPTLRENNGLAMSSRNRRLKQQELENAALLYKTLQLLKQKLCPGATAAILKEATDQLTEAGFKVDYVSISDAATLEPVAEWNGIQQVVALVAAFAGPVRLIDNLPLN